MKITYLPLCGAILSSRRSTPSSSPRAPTMAALLADAFREHAADEHGSRLALHDRPRGGEVALVPRGAPHTKRFKIPEAWRAQVGYHNIFSVPTLNDAWTSEATRDAPLRVDDFYMDAPPGCMAVLKSSKRKGEVCGRVNCKRHRQAADDCSIAAPSTSGGSSPASAGSLSESSSAA